MSGLLSFLRLLMVPLSISLTGALLTAVYMNLDVMDWNEVANMSRMLFVWHATWGLVLTLVVGMPFIRYHTRRQTMVRRTWLILGHWCLCCRHCCKIGCCCPFRFWWRGFGGSFITGAWMAPLRSNSGFDATNPLTHTVPDPQGAAAEKNHGDRH